jgi:hypothetical protein
MTFAIAVGSSGASLLPLQDTVLVLLETFIRVTRSGIGVLDLSGRTLERVL